MLLCHVPLEVIAMSSLAIPLEIGSIVLPDPQWDRAMPLLQMLQARHSSREFSSRVLPLDVLSTLLWAAFGINRAKTTGRTAPSAHNWQEIEVFAVLPEGAYRYEPATHRLLLVKTDDLRGATGTQDFVATAPLNLVYVADFARMHEARADERSFLAGADAGCIAQNVYLYCAIAGLATVVRGMIDRRRLAAALGLAKTERITLAQTVGYPAAA
jgi:SagB-type dehydrogenase family enzyme